MNTIPPDVDTDNLEEFSFEEFASENRKELGYSVRKFSELVGISKSRIQRVEAGQSRYTEAEKRLLKEAFYEVFPERYGYVLIDYVRIRFPTMDLYRILDKVLGISPKYLAHEDRAFYGYAEQFLFGNIRLMKGQEEKQGVLLEMSGHGCREFECILEARRETWHDFFEMVDTLEGVWKRLDLAVDDVLGILSVPLLIRKMENGEYQGLCRNWKQYQSGVFIKERVEDPSEVLGMGQTLYLGSMKSDIYFCIYEKEKEQQVKLGSEYLGGAPVNRVEIRLMNDRSKRSAERFLETGNMGTVAFSILYRYIAFLDPEEGIEKRNWKYSRFWELFLRGVRESFPLSYQAEKPTLERTKKWIARQVAPSLKMILLWELDKDRDFLGDLLDRTALSRKQQAMLRSVKASSEELLSNSYRRNAASDRRSS